MNKDQRQDKPNVTVEDLLRLKRAEKPDAAYWQRFERELRQKTVQTVIREETSLVRFFRGSVRQLRLAVPAAAALALLALLAFGPQLQQSRPLSGGDVAGTSGVNTALPQDTALPARVTADLTLEEELALSEARFDVNTLTAQHTGGAPYTEVHASEKMAASGPDGVFFVVGSLSGSSRPALSGLQRAVY